MGKVVNRRDFRSLPCGAVRGGGVSRHAGGTPDPTVFNPPLRKILFDSTLDPHRPCPSLPPATGPGTTPRVTLQTPPHPRFSTPRQTQDPTVPLNSLVNPPG